MFSPSVPLRALGRHNFSFLILFYDVKNKIDFCFSAYFVFEFCKIESGNTWTI